MLNREEDKREKKIRRLTDEYSNIQQQILSLRRKSDALKKSKDNLALSECLSQIRELKQKSKSIRKEAIGLSYSDRLVSGSNPKGGISTCSGEYKKPTRRK